MERQLLDLLSWDLKIENSDLYHELEMFLKPVVDPWAKQYHNTL
uniref:Cyclin N-terminal domain-containing protein n=1 Tax=Pyricularia oryzae (strain P131) TaxID=1143193 RepID=L7IQT3_PYRO1